MNKFIKSLLYLPKDIEELKISLGRLESRVIENDVVEDLSIVEFKVTSQWGEDGILDYLLKHVRVNKNIFVEFGVENYTESNTRFLLQNRNWTGLVIDGSQKNIEYIKNDSIYWKYNIKAECNFITCENINSIISNNGLSGEIGVLSIDIDGNDYWVWRSIDVVNPAIIICEYNSLFGPIAKITIPYNKDFERNKAHESNLYYGASISALTSLANEKGYSLIGSNLAGNNAFYVRNDLVGSLVINSPKNAYKKAQFRESRDKQGNLNFLGHKEKLKEISDMSVIDIESNREIKIKDVLI